MRHAGETSTAPLAACESLSEDMGGLSSAFKQTTPSEAARWAVDPTDADKRREGIILLSNAPFGSVDVYVNLYRDVPVPTDWKVEFLPYDWTLNTP